MDSICQTGPSILGGDASAEPWQSWLSPGRETASCGHRETASCGHRETATSGNRETASCRNPRRASCGNGNGQRRPCVDAVPAGNGKDQLQQWRGPAVPKCWLHPCRLLEQEPWRVASQVSLLETLPHGVVALVGAWRHPQTTPARPHGTGDAVPAASCAVMHGAAPGYELQPA